MSLENILESLAKDGIQNRPVELGKIKIGGKSAQVRKSASGDWRAPEKYDHFRITTMNRDARGDLIEDKALMDQLIPKYGDADGKLRRIPIRVLSDDLDDILQSAFVWYGGKSVGARSDGERVTWFNNPALKEFGKKIDPPLIEDWTDEFLTYKNPKGQLIFKTHTNFNCIIAAKEARWGGVYRFRTTSVISLRQLHTSLLHLSQLTGGILTGMPMMLVVRPMPVSPDGKPSTVHVVHVELHGPDLMELQKQAMAFGDFRVKFAERIGQTTRQYRKLLAAPGTEGTDEAQDIQEEFQPDDTPLETVPEGTEYSLLSGAAENPPPESAPLIGEPPEPSFIEPPSEPDAPEAVKPAKPNEPDPSETLFIQLSEASTPEEWMKVYWKAAQIDHPEITLEAITESVETHRKLAMRKPGTLKEMSPSGRKSILTMILSGGFRPLKLGPKTESPLVEGTLPR